MKLLARQSDLCLQTSEIENSSSRIIWVDVFKGIAIALVVVGHATGYFNNFIFQFHMPAFFFISGYVFKTQKTTVLNTVWNKLYSLIIPYLSTLVSMLMLSDSFER